MSAQFFSQSIPEIGVEELASRLASATDGIQLIDVREPDEVAIAHVDGFSVLPLSEFNSWSGQIQTRFDPNAETLVMCHHGVRSAQMCQWLMNQGFTNVKNVVGGIDAYSILVDPSVPRY
ncbi:MAG TPA: rhodanese-related sulfurtransferase [Cyanobacteria bacterium UBA11369]|nr:rhodanese-related sulfurtransferase [Cyanobacteria bacterium UBA11371]HBE48079.1 rhodanese-related sulfurtransferase [Cyanobacteria bacterium UBA11369]